MWAMVAGASGWPPLRRLTYLTPTYRQHSQQHALSGGGLLIEGVWLLDLTTACALPCYVCIHVTNSSQPLHLRAQLN
jgi:hypothetical protein